ncbi:hypothetical protein AAY473_031307 [Plecturocebus cupreus]
MAIQNGPGKEAVKEETSPLAPSDCHQQFPLTEMNPLRCPSSLPACGLILHVCIHIHKFKTQLVFRSLRWDWAWWFTPVIPPLWEIEVGRSQGQEFRTSLANMGLALLPRLECSGMITTHCSHNNLSSSGPPASGYRLGGTTAACHQA